MMCCDGQTSALADSTNTNAKGINAFFVVESGVQDQNVEM